MKTIKIPITISPHFSQGVPRGYYIIAQRLFPKERPILFRQQFVGFTQNLVFTMAHPGKWDTLLKMAIYIPTLGDFYVSVSWLSTTKMYPMGTGVRIYLPGTILKPSSAGCKKIETMGSLSLAGGRGQEIYYLDIPKLNADILLGRKELK